MGPNLPGMTPHPPRPRTGLRRLVALATVLAVIAVPSTTDAAKRLTCFGHEPDVIGTKGPDRFDPAVPQPAHWDDDKFVVMGLGGRDYIAVDPSPGEGRWIYVCGGAGDDAMFIGTQATADGEAGWDRAEVTMCGISAPGVVFKTERVSSWPPDHTCN